MKRMGRHEERAFKRVVALSFPATIFGVLLPQVLNGPLRAISMVVGAVLFIAVLTVFFGIGKAGERDYREREQG